MCALGLDSISGKLCGTSFVAKMPCEGQSSLDFSLELASLHGKAHCGTLVWLLISNCNNTLNCVAQSLFICFSLK